MIRFRTAIWAAAVAVATAASAQQAYVIPTNVDNVYFGYIVMPDGKIITLENLRIIKQETPQATWQTDKPRVIIVDDENLRGNLPQEQVNIFTSRPLRDALDSKGFEYRFSSNDDIAEGSDARELEQPIWVEGWDLLLKSDVDLPMWIIGNKTKTVIEPLPEDPDAAIKRLEAFK